TMSQSPQENQRGQSVPMENGQSQDVRMGATSEANLMESVTPTYAMPIFGGNGIERSPFAMADDFAAWLFNEGSFGPNPPLPYQSAGPPVTPSGGSNAGYSLQAPYFFHDPMVAGYSSQPIPPQHPMSVNN